MSFIYRLPWGHKNVRNKSHWWFQVAIAPKPDGTTAKRMRIKEWGTSHQQAMLTHALLEMRGLERALNSEFKTYCRSKDQAKLCSRHCLQLFTTPDCLFPERKFPGDLVQSQAPSNSSNAYMSFCLLRDLPVCLISPDSLKNNCLGSNMPQWKMYRWTIFKFLHLSPHCILFLFRDSCK